MKLYNESIVNKVREQREGGLSIHKLSMLFNIPQATISKWVRDIKSNNVSFIRAREIGNNYKQQSIGSIKNYKINKNSAKILLSFLYWCEGSKLPSTNFVSFSNSDYSLCKTFLYLMKKAYNIDNNNLKIHLQIHSTQDFNKLKTFWSNLLKVPEKNFYKPTVTDPTKKMKRRNYFGTCTIKYHNVKLLYEITGVFEFFAKKFGEVA